MYRKGRPSPEVIDLVFEDLLERLDAANGVARDALPFGHPYRAVVQDAVVALHAARIGNPQVRHHGCKG